MLRFFFWLPLPREKACLSQPDDYNERMPVPEIKREELTAAIIELNSMSPCDGVVMTRAGAVKCGYAADPETLCMLIPAPLLARQLTADGLSSYTGKELKKWAEDYDIAPLQEKVAASVS